MWAHSMWAGPMWAPPMWHPGGLVVVGGNVWIVWLAGDDG